VAETDWSVANIEAAIQYRPLEMKLRFVPVLYVEMGPIGIPLFDSIVLPGPQRALPNLIRTARLRLVGPGAPFGAAREPIGTPVACRTAPLGTRLMVDSRF
jgi:hypothetical protein